MFVKSSNNLKLKNKLNKHATEQNKKLSDLKKLQSGSLKI